MSPTSSRAAVGPLARLLVAVVRLYQLTVSPLLSPRCRFEPSCSSYALEAVGTHGAARGGWLAVRRLARCQPFARGGWDPVPEPADRTSAAVGRLAPVPPADARPEVLPPVRTGTVRPDAGAIAC